MSGAALRVREMLTKFSTAEGKVAECVLADLNSVIGMSVDELALKCHTSKATIIRFCKTCGYSGYRDFMLQLAVETTNNSKDEDEYCDINAGDDIATIAKSVCYNNSKAIDDSYLIADIDSIEKAVNAIIPAAKIDFYGIGASYIVAEDAVSKFMRINKNCTAYASTHNQITSAVNLSKNDVAVAISWSGETMDIIEAARLAKTSGATVISLTRYGESHLSEIADIKLQLSAPETTIRAGAMSSRIAQLNMIDIIYSAVVSLDYAKIKKCLNRTRANVKGKRFTQPQND